MTDFRGPLPLTDRDFAQIRARVLTKVERRPIGLRLALAAAAVAALIFVLLPRHHERPVLGAVPPSHRVAPPRIRVVAPPPMVAEHVVAPPRKPKPLAVASIGSPPPDNDITMEIHTADPDVRIIWIGSR